MKRLSVIIVTYKSEHDIYDCLQSVWKHCDIPKDELEVIIVDNSPECEPMFSRLRELYGTRVILIHNTHNGGYGQGNNVGISKATAPVCMIMNPDVRLTEPVFSTVVRTFDEDAELCLYGIKQMLSEDVVSPKSFVCTRMMNGYAYTLLDAVCNRLNLFLPGIMYFQGACFFLNKAKFEQVGMFDEQIFMYGEEDDIHYRLMRRFGEGFRYDKHIRYIHLMLGRKPNVEYEKKLLEVDVYHHKKKGVSEKSTLTSYLQSNTVLLVRAYIRKVLGGGDSEQLTVLRQFRRHIKHRLSEL